MKLVFSFAQTYAKKQRFNSRIIPAILAFLAGSLTTVAQSNWSLNGADIYNNNQGNVGIGLTNPTGKLEITTSILDYTTGENNEYHCVAGSTTGLIINGRNWDVLPPNATFICNFTGTLPNLFEANVELGAYSTAWPHLTYSKLRRVTINGEGRVGIGDNLDPTEDLDVAGNIRMRSGAQNGYVATSNASGVMTWQPSGATSFWEQIPGVPAGHIRNKTYGEVHIGVKPYSLMFDPKIAPNYRHINKADDVGIFFGETTTEGDGLTPGFVIAPRNFNNPWAGLRMDWDGSVCIGCNDAKGYKLAVDGNVVAELVRVKLNSNWPDYVFEYGYQLKPLAEVESYIKENGHLEGLPKAAKVHQEGIDLGEMNRLLLEKVEELTLYVIELEKKIEAK